MCAGFELTSSPSNGACMSHASDLTGGQKGKGHPNGMCHAKKQCKSGSKAARTGLVLPRGTVAQTEGHLLPGYFRGEI